MTPNISSFIAFVSFSNCSKSSLLILFSFLLPESALWSHLAWLMKWQSTCIFSRRLQSSLYRKYASSISDSFINLTPFAQRVLYTLENGELSITLLTCLNKNHQYSERRKKLYISQKKVGHYPKKVGQKIYLINY